MPRAGLKREYKTEILEKLKSGKKVSELAVEYGISDKTIYRWTEVRARSNGVLEISKLKRQNGELLRLVGQLTYEQELKKKGFNC